MPDDPPWRDHPDTFLNGVADMATETALRRDLDTIYETPNERVESLVEARTEVDHAHHLVSETLVNLDYLIDDIELFPAEIRPMIRQSARDAEILLEFLGQYHAALSERLRLAKESRDAIYHD